jgi:hypothetical protein
MLWKFFTRSYQYLQIKLKENHGGAETGTATPSFFRLPIRLE